jgi:hypothetical protein
VAIHPGTWSNSTQLQSQKRSVDTRSDSANENEYEYAAAMRTDLERTFKILAMLKKIVQDIPKQGTRTDDAYQKEKERDKRRVADIQPILDQILTLQYVCAPTHLF